MKTIIVFVYDDRDVDYGLLVEHDYDDAQAVIAALRRAAEAWIATPEGKALIEDMDGLLDWQETVECIVDHLFDPTRYDPRIRAVECALRDSCCLDLGVAASEETLVYKGRVVTP